MKVCKLDGHVLHANGLNLDSLNLAGKTLGDKNGKKN